MNKQQTIAEIVTQILNLCPKIIDVNQGSNIAFLVEEQALYISDLYYEVDRLKHIYNINDQDLIFIAKAIDRLKLVPARVLQKISEGNVDV